MSVKMNDDIKHQQVLLINELGENVGEVKKSEALDRAYELGLDLVQMNDNNIPVCKIMDYKKHLYEQKKKQRSGKESKTKWKEIQLSLSIGEHDLQVKAKNALKQLEKGHKVKVVLMLKGREITHKDLGKNVLKKFKELCKDVNVEKDIFSEGNKLIMFLG